MKDVAWRQVEEYITHQKEVKEQNTKGEKKEHEQKH
jgi:hypothetical protein